MMHVKDVPTEKQQLVGGAPEDWNAAEENDSEGRNPYDARDRLDSYHIVPVILSEISALKELMDSSGDAQGGSGGAIPPRYNANSGAVLLLRCSDESFDTVMKSLDHQDIQLAIGMLEQQISLEEQTESSLTHLSQLYRQTSMEKFLNTAHALMKSQQRLAWIRSRILRCMSKHLALVSNGQMESRLEPLLKRVLRFPDLAYKYVPPEDTAPAATAPAAAPSPPQTALVTNGHAATVTVTTADSVSPRVQSPVRQAAVEEEPPAIVSITPPLEGGNTPVAMAAANGRRDSSSGTPTNATPQTPPPQQQQQQQQRDDDATESCSTPQPADLALTAPLVGMLMSQLDKEGVSSVSAVDRNNNSGDDDDDDDQRRSRRMSGSPPPVPVNSRSTPAGENGAGPAAQLSLPADVLARSPSPLTDADQPLSPLVSSLFGNSRIVGASEQEQEEMPDGVADLGSGQGDMAEEMQCVRELEAVLQLEPEVMTSPLTSPTGGLMPPEPPRRSSSYEVLRKFEHTRSASRSSGGSASQHSSPSKSLSDPDRVPEGFADAHFLGNLLSESPTGHSPRSSPSRAPTEDTIEEKVLDEMESGELEFAAEPSTGEINASEADVPQFVGNLSSLMSSRIVFD